MGDHESADTWSAWFLDAIRKIRSQKQRPSVERICHAIRQHHNYHEEEIAEHLEIAVKRGDVLKIFNKGQSSYKDPGGLQSRPLKVGKATDLSKVVGKAVRELGERDGSNLKNIEKYVRQSHTVEEEADGDLRTALRLSAKRAVDRGFVIQDGRLFRQPDRPPNSAKKVPETSSHNASSDSLPNKLPAPLPICKECLGATTASNNNNTKRNVAEKLSRCSVCGAALHNSCAPAELSILVDRGATWSCDDCSPTCAGCKLERESQNYLVKCAGCVKCYHPSCLDPALDKKNKAPWSCRHCQTAHTPNTPKDDAKKHKGQDTASSADGNTPTSTRKRLSKMRENRKSGVSRKSLTASTPGKKSSVAVAQVDSSSDGNAGVVSPRQPALMSSPVPQAPTQLAGQGRLLEEKNDRISKEKQKFFRLSAFNADHNKLKRVGGGNKSRSSQSISPRSSRRSTTPKKAPPGRRVPALSSSSSSEASDSDTSASESSDEEDENEDNEDEEEGSSSESSDSSSSEECEEGRLEPRKPGGPFSCDLSEDKPWGFAAAAAKLNVESPFFSNITNTFGAPLPKLDLSNKPTFGLHIQPAASPVDSKRKQKERSATTGVYAADNKVKPGSGQLKGLFDGLSHFFSAPSNTSRVRSGAQAPNYAPDRRKRPNNDDLGTGSSKAHRSAKSNTTPKTTEDERVRSERKRTEEKEESETSRVPRPGIFTPSDESPFESEPKMTPSNLVKTAVNSKRHEHERRRMMKEQAVKCSGDSLSPSSPTKNDLRKKQAITESTQSTQSTQSAQTRHPEPAAIPHKSHPGPVNPNPKSSPRACTSATTTNTTTTPRATPCSTRKDDSTPPQTLPPGVTQKDVDLFKEARDRANRLTVVSEDEDTRVSASPGGTGPGVGTRNPAVIVFGRYEVETWYSSPFPQEYARLPKLFFCEFCLKYTKSRAVLDRHMDKCQWRHPPATEIYRCNGLSVFEIDGNVNKIYCQNLCLLAKLFLDHKTLYYDVEPFLFYAVTKNDKYGCHLVGYFSKEKHCPAQRYNVSCIMTLPQYQRQGFGRFLIEFSYLLSKVEAIPGTPEKPLSDLGRVSYHSFWKSVVLEYLDSHRAVNEIKLGDITKETGVSAHDIAMAMQLLGFIRSVYLPGEEKVKLAVVVDWDKVDAHMAKVRKSSRIKLDPDCLRWIPLLTQIPNPYQSPEEGGETSSETSPLAEPKPIPTIVEKIQRVKIKKRPRGRRNAARKSSPLKPKAPQRMVPRESKERVKELEKDSGNVADVEDEKEDMEVEVKNVSTCKTRGLTTPKGGALASTAAKATPIVSSRRRIRTAKAAAVETPTAAPAAVRKRKHSEKTESEDKEKVENSRKRTRESLREKEKEKERGKEKEKEKEKVKEREKEVEREKVREAEKESPAEPPETPPKDATSTATAKPSAVQKPTKKKSKLDDILMKVTSRQTKYLQAKQAKEKKALEDAQCNGKDEAKEVKSSTVSRRGRTKTSAAESAKVAELKSETPEKEERKENTVVSTPSHSPSLEEVQAKPSKQLTIPEMFPRQSDRKESKTQSVEDSTIATQADSEIPTASPGEYEGGDEDEGEEEEPAPRPKSIPQSHCISPCITKERTEKESSQDRETSKGVERSSPKKTELQLPTEEQTEQSKESPKEPKETQETPKEDVAPEPETPAAVPQTTLPADKIHEKAENFLSDDQSPSENKTWDRAKDTKETLVHPKSESPSLSIPAKKVFPVVSAVAENPPTPSQEKVSIPIIEQDTGHLQAQPEEKQHSPESGKTTPHLENPGSVKRTPPSQPDLPSMGVYTPDSTTNSVHSLHYGQCDLDVSQLGLESPTSIASDLASQNSVERPPSALPSMPSSVPAPISTSVQITAPPVSVNIPNQVQYADCSMPQHTPPAHVAIHPMHQPHTPQPLQQPRTPQSHTPQSIPTQSPQPMPQSHTPQPLSQSHTPQSIPTQSPQPMPQSHTPQPLPQSHTPQPIPQSHTPQPMQLSLAQQSQNQQPMGHSQPAHQQTQSHSSKRASGSQTTHRSRSTQQSSRSHRATPPTSHAQSSQHAAAHPGHSTVAHGTHLPPQYQQTSSMTVPPVPHHSHSHAAHSHAMISQGNYMAVASQAFPTQNTYVIQHRGTRSGAPTPSTTATNFYIQTSAMPPHSHTPAPSLAPSGNHQAANSHSLAKLQQLTNGLEMIPPTPPPPMNLTPPPPIPHTMTPPQTSRQLPTPPQVPLGYTKNYYNVNTVPPPGTPGPSSRSASRSSANANMASLAQPYASESLYRQTLDPGGTCPQMQSAATRVSPNVALNTNLMAAAQYGYRVAQPATGYMNQAAQLGGFMNQASQLPVGVVNVPAPYSQDPHQQNPVYTTYHGYINGSLMQPLNGTMRPR